MKTEMEFNFEALSTEAREKLKELAKDGGGLRIYLQPFGGGEPVAIADIRKVDNCPDWLFEKVMTDMGLRQD